MPACGTSSKPDDFCSNCNPPDAVFNCHKNYNDKYVGSVCMDADASAAQVQFECESSYGTRCGLQGCYGVFWPCDGSGDVTGGADCTGWNPGSHVAFSGGVYHVDEGFVAQLVDDSVPLLDCDGARFEPLSTGKYKVVGASSSTFVYKLGLRNDDIPQSINGMPLDDSFDGAQALGDLYLAGETNYTLVVKRGSSNITLYYEITP